MMRFSMAVLFWPLALGTIPASAQSGLDGATIYRQRCICEKISSLAPALTGVVGRKAASTGFFYSLALFEPGLVWTRVNLDRYLTRPARMVAGTKMAVDLPNAEQRRALIDYLAERR